MGPRRPTLIVLVPALVLAACSSAAGSAATSTTIPVTTTRPATTTTSSTTTTTVATTTTTSSTTTTTVPPTTTTTVPPFREITPEQPLRVWVIGDSLAGPVGRSFRNLADPTGLVVTRTDSRGGSGLVSPAYFDWPATVAERLPQVAPDVVVVILAANDGEPIWSGGRNLAVGSREWDAAYREMVSDFMAQVAAGTTHVYWVGLPAMAKASYDAKVVHFNALLAGLAAVRPEVSFVEIYSLFVDENGDYAQVLPNDDGVRVALRDGDGVHYTWAGAQRAAGAIFEAVAADWGIGAAG